MARVLIVDDAKVMRLLLKKVFEELGHIVVDTASDGLEACLMYEMHKPDFVVMDMEMPNVNGLDALIKIKKMDMESKIVIISSSSDTEYIKNAFDYGARGYILKPITLSKASEITKAAGF